eukprot:TRINITY_DN16309_c0_g1_i3.p1 TRINITY_DN16309_c0_g1~~TRINITY_DN16309_c0_g1_i3.p1  ORF type:complete len:205 (-),score=41.68 TRINITY_DN16309_c0_g1_i3:102-716(-)
MGCRSSHLGKRITRRDANAAETPTNQIMQDAWALGVDLTVTLERKCPSDIAGISLSCLDDNSMVIKGVQDGLVREWNEAHADDAELQVRVGDIILAVNNLSRCVRQMLDEIDASRCVVLYIRRAELPLQEPASEQKVLFDNNQFGTSVSKAGTEGNSDEDCVKYVRFGKAAFQFADVVDFTDEDPAGFVLYPHEDERVCTICGF